MIRLAIRKRGLVRRDVAIYTLARYSRRNDRYFPVLYNGFWFTMCGIAGLAGLSTVNQAAVKAMTDLMTHRGPDGEGLWRTQDGRLCFGHRRLAILDLSRRAAQPFQSADGSYCITYNGELYNYLELAERLRQNGSVFRTTSDTEVVLEAYRQWGEDCLGEFNGMFAFAIYDQRRGVVFCARDRFGEKPFLFLERPGLFAFASDYKALFALEGVDVDVDKPALLRFLDSPANGLDHQRQTVFRGICQLLPAEKLLLNLGDLSWSVEKYWDATPGSEPASTSQENAVSHFRDLIDDAVKIRLRSDVAVGSCLSGGLDSSSITCLSRRLLGDENPYHVFTGRFPGSPADEGSWADAVVAATHAIQHQTKPDAEGLMEDLDDFIWLNELPVDSASQYAQWCVFRLAAENGVTVLLDGQGADEILGGYEQYFASYLRSHATTPDEERLIRERYPLALSGVDQAWKTSLPFGLRRAAAHALGRGSDLKFGIGWKFVGEIVRNHDQAFQAETLRQALHHDACNGFLTTLLRYGDRNSMAHSREVRLPFCDHRIAEYAFSLPENLLMGKAQTKYLLREAMRDILPEPVRTRWNKQGFLPPQAQWFRDGLLDLAEQVFNGRDFAQNPMWDARWWQRAARRLRRGEDALAVQLWKPFIGQLWLTSFVERARNLPRVAPLRADYP
ncbi:MAG: asparagine synthase (glutamine-hydrolyzing) [Alphaproteobacteria bacterium]|nr:asparagine synthase (glutamine-hydrolyzing) [Alphaproteobacteria bacterium]MBL6931619.1 asparagine synthase (glutamine-hydrolyzing) [Rhodospirillales bacterium]